MKKLIFALLLCGLYATPTLLGQKGTKPNSEEVALAKELQATYEEEKIVLIKTNETYTFGYDSKNKKVTVKEEIRKRYMNIDGEINVPINEFYDAESEIKKVKVVYKTGKKKDIYLNDSYYNVSDYFYSDLRRKHFTLNFPTQGYQYEVEVEKKYKDVKYFTTTYFTSVFPILEKKIRFVIPRWLKLELKELNFDGYDIAKAVTYDKKADADVYTYLAKNLAPTVQESHGVGPSHLYPHFLVLAKSFNRNGQETMLFNSTQDLYNWYRSLVGLIKDEEKVLEGKVAEITADAKTDIEKVKAIYYWVQDNIRYIAFEDGIAGFKPDECQNVFNNKYGDCKGMANLTKQMLILAGYDARLTWIGTQRIAYDYSLPSLAVDNHMICTVILADKKYFLDPTEKYNSFSEYAERIQGKEAMIEDGEGFILEKIPVSPPSHNIETVNRNLVIDGETFKGTSEHVFNGESRAGLLYNINQTETDRLEDALKYYVTRGDKNIRISALNTSDLNNRDETFKIKYDIEQKNAISAFGDEMYIDIDFYKEFSHLSFDEKRKTDYLFSYKINLVSNTEIEIPDGYNIKQLPEGFQKSDEGFSFDISYQQKENKLIYRKEIAINKTWLKKTNFENWNQCIKQLNDLYKEQVVLTKQ